MSVNDFISRFPKAEKVVMNYNAPGGVPLYVITRHEKTGTYKLYGVEKDGYRFLKSRSADPLFKEVIE